MTSEADTLERWFAIADANHDGRIEGAEAISFFQKSGLPRETLKEVTMLAEMLFLSCCVDLGKDCWIKSLYEQAAILWSYQTGVLGAGFVQGV